MEAALFHIYISMLEYLIQLPCEVMGERMMGFLDLNDIMQFESSFPLLPTNCSYQTSREPLYLNL